MRQKSVSLPPKASMYIQCFLIWHPKRCFMLRDFYALVNILGYFFTFPDEHLYPFYPEVYFLTRTIVLVINNVAFFVCFSQCL